MLVGVPVPPAGGEAEPPAAAVHSLQRGVGLAGRQAIIHFCLAAGTLAFDVPKAMARWTYSQARLGGGSGRGKRDGATLPCLAMPC